MLLALLSFAALSLACGGESNATATVGAGTVPTRAPSTPLAESTAAATVAAPTPEPTATQPPATQPAAASQAAAPTQPPPTQPPAPQPTQPPAPSGPVIINISARNLLFDRRSITVPSNTLVTVNFTNNDTAVPHDFGVSIPQVPHTATCDGPCQASLTFNSGPPARHTFQCTIHVDMVGDFIVN
jgi:hypothetical protein